MLQPEVSRQPELQVSEVRDRRAFARLEPEWNALVARSNDEPFYRHDFLRLWIEHFARETPLRILTARDREGALQGVLPLIEQTSRLFGVPLRTLSATANAHSCRFDLVASDPLAVADAFLSHLSRDRTWDVMQLGDVPANGQAWTLLERARARHLPFAAMGSIHSPYVPLPTDEALLTGQLDARFRANLRRRRKRLAEKGRIELEIFSSGAELEQRLAEGFALEQSGWKGTRGTAIAQSEQTRGFYTELARHHAHRGQLALMFLRLDGRAVAFHFALTHRDRYLLLKPAYDETLRECSPGQLLMEDALRTCIQRRMVEFDFLGPDMIWKRDWTDRVRAHATLFLFRDNRLGRLLCTARFHWAPRLKRTVMRRLGRLAGGAA